MVTAAAAAAVSAAIARETGRGDQCRGGNGSRAHEKP
jgi:hypothetical protein